MADTHTALAALIGSRICHDLISPIGAINNGLELLSMSGDASGPEIGLIGESVGNAAARIRFFRIAFGAAGDQMVGTAEVQSILRDLYETGRLQVTWGIGEPVQRADVRMAFLALMCAEAAFPYGGKLNLTHVENTWHLFGKADRINLDPELWRMLSTGSTGENVPPSQVQFALLPLFAGERGRTIKVKSDTTSLDMSY
ncbi:MAG: histidine phosphotransferase family protein [Pseudomonadota bacterium]